MSILLKYNRVLQKWYNSTFVSFILPLFFFANSLQKKLDSGRIKHSSLKAYYSVSHVKTYEPLRNLSLSLIHFVIEISGNIWSLGRKSSKGLRTKVVTDGQSVVFTKRLVFVPLSSHLWKCAELNWKWECRDIYLYVCLDVGNNMYE